MYSSPSTISIIMLATLLGGSNAAARIANQDDSGADTDSVLLRNSSYVVDADP